MRIACYARTSNDLHTDSIENQFAIMDAYIGAKPDLHGAEILRFADQGESGIDTEREEFQELLTQVRQRRINCIIIKDFSRLGRNYLDICKLTESILPFMGVRLISINENYDSVKAANAVDLTTAFKSVLNEYYVIETSEKLKESCKQRTRNGEIIGSVPYGYRKLDKYTVVIAEEEAAVVREIYQRFLNGQRMLDIAADLNRRHTPAMLGGKWAKNTVYRVLKNERYTGRVVALKSTIDVKTKQRIQYPESEWYVNERAFPPIIERDTYITAQSLISAGRVQMPTAKHLMARKLFCAGCGKALQKNKISFQCKLPQTTGEKPCFSGKLLQSNLYPKVLDTVKAAIRVELSAYKQQFSFSEIVKIENEIAGLKEEKALLFEEMLTEQIGQQEFRVRNEIIGKQIKDKLLIADEKRRCYALTAKLGSAERPIETFKRLYAADELNHEHMQFVKRITVSDPDHFEIELMDESPLAVLCRNVGIYEED